MAKKLHDQGKAASGQTDRHAGGDLEKNAGGGEKQSCGSKDARQRCGTVESIDIWLIVRVKAFD